MATKQTYPERQRAVPPYGPTRGMLQALDLLRRTTPARVDSDYLRETGVAPGNEYKVAGALRFLGLIDEAGRPTEKSRLLKTRGNTYAQTLKEIVRDAYRDLFLRLESGGTDKDEVYNYFVTEGKLGSEMATKASRFFIHLCHLAGIEMASQSAAPAGGRRKRPESGKRDNQPGAASPQHASSPDFPLVLAITPDTADMDVERLTRLFRKMRLAWELSLAPEG